MNTYETCKWLRQIILTAYGELNCYLSNPDFWSNEIKTLADRIKTKNPDIKINLSELTGNEMKELGFGKWSEESKDYLIPIWLYPFLPENINTNCIDSTQCLKKSEMDTDHRFGYLAYSIVPKNENS